ncbi:fatty acyl-CoA reductase wat-like, partial [Sabethes cyaneus]|uniref:fatty acyl-CoA reductase wat-like n=1 Tax=Sabethes cyaneus TaxID=53552 RepID=UPI00237E4F64
LLSSVASEPSIPETFAGADVFITGGSGFLGKVLIEKLLRSCPDIGHVFVLLRQRKGKSAEERVKEIVQIPLFDKLRELRPNDIQKIEPISGDCSLLQLGLDDESRKRIENVQFVFHGAASVRFDDTLTKAILLNTRGTREVFHWAKSLKHLKSLVHISTTYCNPEIFDVEEKIYPAKMDWRLAIRMAETLESEKLDALVLKLTNFAPNTYTFTKGLAEQICYDHHRELPVVILRPSIVTNTEQEPVAGWIDNFNGPVGLMLGMGIGLLRTAYVRVENHMNCIPADACIKAILIAAWRKVNNPPGQLTIYNCAAEPHKTANYKFLVDDGESVYRNSPMNTMVWAPGGNPVNSRFLFYILFFFYQLLPAVFIDLLMKGFGTKPLLLKIQRKIMDAHVSLNYFMQNDWTFATKHFRGLSTALLEKDRESFNTDYIRNGLFDYYQTCLLGSRRYMFNEPDDTIPAAKRKLQRYIIFHAILKLSLCCMVGYLLWNKYSNKFIRL